MLMSNLHKTFIFSRVFLGKTAEICSTSISRSNGVAICVFYLLAVSIHSYSVSLHIDQIVLSALLAMTLIPFRGPDFWTEMRVASCDQ